MTTVLETLKAARDLLVTKGWTQHYYAKDTQGAYVSATAPEATCFCGWGAIHVVTEQFFGPEFNAADDALRTACGVTHFPSFNDAPGRTLDEVLEVFDKAIAIQEAAHDPQ